MKYFDKDEDKTIPTKDRIMLTYEILSRTSFSNSTYEPSVFSGNDKDRDVGIERLVNKMKILRNTLNSLLNTEK